MLFFNLVLNAVQFFFKVTKRIAHVTEITFYFASGISGILINIATPTPTWTNSPTPGPGTGTPVPTATASP